MNTLPREKALKIWQRYWDESSKEFFKVEALQHYNDETVQHSPSLSAWLAGDKDKSINLIKKNASEWAEQCRARPDIEKIRIHIVEEPYSPYLKWEIEHYKLVNIPTGGEHVFLANKIELSAEAQLGDFMIFDNKRVAHSHYSIEGKMWSMDLYDERDDISEFLRAKDELIAKARPIVV